MTSGFESAIGEAMAELEKQRNTLVHLTEGMDQITGTARSKRRQVSVTVDARGEITELTFHGQGYKSLPPADLARIIVETIQDAKQSAQEQLWASLDEVDPEGREFAQAATEIDDWSDLLGEVITLPKPLLDLLNAPPEFGDLPQYADFGELLSALGQAGNGVGGAGGSGAGGDGAEPVRSAAQTDGNDAARPRDD